MNMHANVGLIEIVATEIREMLGDEFDQETFLDTLDGETDAMDIIGTLVSERVEAKAHADASKAASQEYSARAKRLTEKQAAISSALGKVLDAMGERKVAHPLATVSRTKGRASVKILDEAAIPTQLTVTTVKPDASAIKKQIEAGEYVPGAAIETGPEGVTVRIK